MLHIFAMIFKRFFRHFSTSVLDACIKCFICLQKYVASVASGYCKIRSGVASPSSLSDVSPQCFVLPALAGIRPLPLSLFLDAGDIRGYAGIMWAHKMAWEMAAGTGVRMPRPSGRLGASKPHQYLIHFVWTKYRWISYIICIYGE
jgi:hypothetical protein